MDILRKFVKVGSYTLAALAGFGLILVVGLYFYISPTLPSIDSLKDTQFQVPLRIYTDDGRLMSEFGEKRRIPIAYKDIPDLMIKAVLGAEDDRFFEHFGVDYQGLLRAVVILVLTGEKVQGGSTITMQVARNFFLSSEKTFFRKFSEILLAITIEKELSKEEILELYLNKIYLGNRAYGVAAAARVYYGKDIHELSLPQLAMIAGLPKAPSRYNPIANSRRALLRRDYVLRRMRDLGYIDQAAYDVSVLSPDTSKLHGQPVELEAPYASEMARQEMSDRFGNDVYTAGYRVYTTIDSRLQDQANLALRKALLDYETRHGYRGPVAKWDISEASEIDEWQSRLQELDAHPMLETGVVITLEDDAALVYTASNQIVWLCWKGVSWAAPYIDGNAVGTAPKSISDVLSPGYVIYMFRAGNRWVLGQVPEVEGALVSLRSRDGAIKSVVGGFDFERSKFNRATQAKRQPGSNIKPFVYSGALEKGYTTATLINDAPVVFNDPGLEDTWRPENYSGQFFGPTRMREALVKSRNLVSIRILRSVGVGYAINYLKRFGFDSAQFPRDLSLALGSASLTPMEIARGYTVFSNGGYLVEPYIITRIESADGAVLYQANPTTVCEECLAKQEEKEKRLAEQAASRTALGGVLLDNVAGSGQDQSQAGSDELADNAEPPADDGSDTGESAAADSVTDLTPPGPEDISDAPIVKLAKRTVAAQNVYIMTSIMRDIIDHGTGRRAKTLGRNDLAGKTGTTNDQRDAWFSGFNGEIATTAWVGFDKPHPLGDFESGARAALPMWIDYMREALRGTKEVQLQQPPGIVTMRIDPATGMLAPASFPGAIFEIFDEKHIPKQTVNSGSIEVEDGGTGPSSGGDGNTIPELF